MQEELSRLQHEERPQIAETLKDGSASSGKKRLREIDQRVRHLTKRLESAELVDPANQQGLSQAFFGATVTYARQDGVEHTVLLVGIDEAEPVQGKISWLSPVAKALMKSREGDTVELLTPAGPETIEVLSIRYVAS